MAGIDTQLVIVGSGPAGMAAAMEAAKNGVRVTLLDEGQKMGGQIYRQFPDGFQVNENQLDKKYLDKYFFEGKEFIERFYQYSKNIKIMENVFVWGIFPGREVGFIYKNKNGSLKCQMLILAEGAYERPMPFPGWTLPGVITAGGLQTLLKTQRVLSGRRILLSGTGPMQWVLASQLMRVGAEIVAVLESCSLLKLKYLLTFWGQRSLVKEGLLYLNNLRKAGVPFLKSHAVIEARGREEVEKAIYSKVTRDAKPIPGTEKEVDVDTICLGYGFISSSHLAHLCGCEHRYDQVLGCWVTKHNENMETSVEGVYVAGDCAGVAGHLVAQEEGRLAGIWASQKLGTVTQEEARQRSLPILKKLKKLCNFATALNKIFAIRPGLYSRITGDTFICRCEEITAGEIRNMISAHGDMDLNEIKRVTRVGMGNCQGRMCMPALAAIVSTEKEMPIEKLGHITYRAPVRPIRLSALFPG